ncbi:MAG TPA: hypothetical protein VGA34_11630, partial [Alteraurantiacibacter sp.]
MIMSDAGNQEFYGVTSNGALPSAFVTSTANGEFNQQGVANAGDATLVISNAGTATIGAIADGTGAGFGNADAFIGQAIFQSASATATTGVANASISNAGVLNILASGVQGGTGGSPDAVIETAIQQFAFGGVGANVALNNSGTLAISAVASAVETTTGAFGAVLNGASGVRINWGIYQSAIASNGDASVLLDNSGDITISVLANGVDDDSVIAEASLAQTGIVQYADATGGDAAVALANNGDISIGVDAIADAGDAATADVFMRWGIAQSANASSGDASASLTNGADNTLTIGVGAVADGSVADADASIDYAIRQRAAVSGGATGDASVSLANDGTLTIAALADADATTAGANAFASIDYALWQFASNAAGGDATVDFGNAGTIDLSIVANADGETAANASAILGQFLSASANASGGGDAAANLANSGD